VPNDSQKKVLECRENFCVVAGAGSGKTGTMVEYLLRFVEEDPENRSLSNLLALTFTEKAAAEMREKITQSLRLRLEKAAAQDARDAQEARNARDGRDLRPEKGRLGQALWIRETRALGQASISTIHSYALSLLAENSFYLSLPPGLAMEDSGSRDLNEVLCDWMQEEDADLGIALDYLNFRSWGFNSSSVTGLLAAQLAKLSGWGLEELVLPREEPPETAALVRELQGALAVLLKQASAEEQEKYPQIAKVLADSVLWELVHKYLEAPGDLRQLKADLPEFYPGAAGLTSEVSKVRAKVKAKVKEACQLAASLRSRLLGLLIDRYTEPFSEALARISQKLLPRIQARRQAEGKVSFDDMLILTRRLLQIRPQLRAAQHRRWKLTVVDEFQDTNRLQADILALFLNEAGSGQTFDGLDWTGVPETFRAFGDLKQSIYRFRGAEPRIMTDLMARLPEQGGRVLELDTNYRSQKKLVEFYSCFFARYLGPDSYAVQKPSRPDLTDIAPVTWLTTEDDDPENKGYRPSWGAWKKRQAQLLADYLQDVFSGRARVMVPDEAKSVTGPPAGRPPLFGEAAILVRQRKNAPYFEKALREAGIPCHTLEGSYYFSFPEISGLAAAALYLAGRTPDYYLAVLLASPLGPVSPQALEKLLWSADSVRAGEKSQPPGTGLTLRSFFTSERRPFPRDLPPEDAQNLSEIRELLLALAPLALRRPPGELLETLAEARGLLPAAAGGPGGSAARVRRIQTFLGLVKNLNGHDPDTGLSAEDLLAELWAGNLSEGEGEGEGEGDDGDREAGRENDGFPETPEEQLLSPAVKILTVHQAKGLEFPVVILPEIDIPRPKPKVPLLVTGSGLMAVKAKDRRGVPLEGLSYGRLAAENEAEDLPEHRRLFYVAATRARDHLIVLGRLTKSGNDSWLDALINCPEAREFIQRKTPASDRSLPESSEAAGAGPAKSPESSEAAGAGPKKPRESSASSGAGRLETGPPASPEAGPDLLAGRDENGFHPALLEKLPESRALYTSVTNYCRLLAQDRPPAAGDPFDPGEDRFFPDPQAAPAGPDGPTDPRERGILFHALLEETDYSFDLEDYLNLLEKACRRRRQNPTAREREFLAGRALEFQNSRFGQEAGEAVRSGRILWREMAFWMKLDKDEQGWGPVVLNGIMDLFYVRADGRGQVIDYKLARPGHFEVYQKQADLYCEAIRRSGFGSEVQGSLWFAVQEPQAGEAH
jgi:ATP-dependent exoDNAse (exonuclease V) beta subunit